MAEVKFCFDSNGINHPLNQYDVNRHAEEVKQLWDDYNKRKNKRIPMAFACDESF